MINIEKIKHLQTYLCNKMTLLVCGMHIRLHTMYQMLENLTKSER